MRHNKDNFPEIESEPNWFLTWIIRVFLFTFSYGLLILIFYATPILLYLDEVIFGRGAFLFFSVYYPFIICMSVLFVKIVRRDSRHNSSNIARKITVNSKGVHYERKNGTIDSILYSQLEKSKTPERGDVFAEYSGGRYNPQPLLKVNVKGKELTLKFNQVDFQYTYYVSNRKELLSHFIQGVQIFRPKLKIDHSVYVFFYIDPETHTFDQRKYWRDEVIIACVIMVLIFLGIMWYVWSR